MTEFNFSAESVLLLTTGGIVFILLITVWPKRHRTTARYLSYLLFAVAIWVISLGLGIAATTIERKVFFAQFEHLGFQTMLVTLFLFGLALAGREHIFPSLLRKLITFMPVIWLAIIFTNPYHYLFWSGFTPINDGSRLIFERGPFYWGIAVYNYLLLAFTTAVIIRTAVTQPAFTKRQRNLIVAGIIIPWAFNIAYLTRLLPFPFDPTGLAISSSTLLFSLAIYRENIHDIIPIARDLMVDMIPEAIITIDRQGDIIDMNPAACELAHSELAQVVQTPAAQVYAAWPSLANLLQEENLRHTPAFPDTLEDNHGRFYSLNHSPLYSTRQQQIGWILILHDITRQKRTEQELRDQELTLAVLDERERLSRELHDGLAQSISSISLQAQAAQIFLEDDKRNAINGSLTSILTLTKDANQAIREFIFGLRLPSTTSGDMHTLLRDYIKQYEEQTQLNVTLILPPESDSLIMPTPIEEQVLRIIQEALTNIRKHAEATHVDVVVQRVEAHLRGVVSDNGRGFDIEAHHQQKNRIQFGLEMMQERARKVGGKLEIHSKPGHGTKLILTIPLAIATHANAPSLDQARLLLVDDSPIFLDGLCNLLRARGQTVVGTAQDGVDALKKVHALQPDVVVMDILMPQRNGIETCAAIKRTFPHIKVIMLTSSEDSKLLTEAIQQGADGFLVKGVDTNEFMTALQKLVEGKMVIPPDLAAKALRQEDEQVAPQQLKKLSPTQLQILEGIGQGKTYKTISRELGFSERTVKYHVSEMKTVLGVTKRAELVAYCRSLGREAS